MACDTLFEVLRAKTEDLGPHLYARASWRDVWMNVVPRGEYPKGAGYVRSVFTIARSEPGTDEETWQPIATQDPNTNANGPCTLTYNTAYVGHLENTYKPEAFGLQGPVVCQDEFTMAWKTEEFWNEYFQALEKRNAKSISNRIGNVYRNYSYKAAAGANFAFTPGKWATQPIPSYVDMSDYLPGGALGLPNSDLTQDMLDATATELIEEGAMEGDTNGWITMGPDGPVFPLYIGQQMSQRLLLNNSELRSDLNQSFQGWGDANPVIKRIGASRQLKNFRHVINVFPARWMYVPNTAVVVIGNSGLTSSASGTIRNQTVYNGTTTVTTVNSATGTVDTYQNTSGTGVLVRIPTWFMASDTANVTKGYAAVVNGAWRDPNVTVKSGTTTNAATFESAEVLNPLMMTQEVLMPVNSMPGMKLKPQNYFGEWKFVTGNDAFLGMNSCTGIQDPMHKQGRHFGEFRCAYRPQYPMFGRMILFSRCANSFDTVTCS